MFRCSGDDTFGPVLGSSSPNPGCYNFDFTLVFEDSIFSILPCGIAIVLGAWRLYALVKRQVAVQWPLLRALKAVSFCAASINCRGPLYERLLISVIAVCLYSSIHLPACLGLASSHWPWRGHQDNSCREYPALGHDTWPAHPLRF